MTPSGEPVAAADSGGYLVPRRVADKLIRMFERDALVKALEDARLALADFDKEQLRRDRISESLRRYWDRKLGRKRRRARRVGFSARWRR